MKRRIFDVRRFQESARISGQLGKRTPPTTTPIAAGPCTWLRPGVSHIIFQNWKNPLLTWNPPDYGDIKEVDLPPDRLWVPDIILYNKYGNAPNSISTRALPMTKPRLDQQISVNLGSHLSWFAPFVLGASYPAQASVFRRAVCCIVFFHVC